MSGPYCLTVSFVSTNSPGVSIAGTVSPLPLPGTKPPVANFLGLPAPAENPPGIRD